MNDELLNVDSIFLLNKRQVFKWFRIKSWKETEKTHVQSTPVTHRFPSRWMWPPLEGPGAAPQGRWSWSSAAWRWQRRTERQQKLGWQEKDGQPGMDICNEKKKKKLKIHCKVIIRCHAVFCDCRYSDQQNWHIFLSCFIILIPLCFDERLWSLITFQ